MNHPLPSRRTFNLSLGVAFTMLLSQSLEAGPNPSQTTPTSSAPPAPAPVQGPVKTAPTGPVLPTTKAPAKTAPGDYGVFKPGGTVYSSGTDDVIVQVLNSNLIRPLPPGGKGPDLSPFNSGLYLLSPGPARFIASNKDAGKSINLGKLPPGELIFGLRVNEYDCYFRTGAASRNPDNLAHASVRTFPSGGLVEIWFEDALGLKGTGRSDRDMNDLVILLSGGIDNGGMADLAQAIQQQPAASREATLAELKKLDPKTAAAVVSAPRPEAAK